MSIDAPSHPVPDPDPDRGAAADPSREVDAGLGADLPHGPPQNPPAPDDAYLREIARATETRAMAATPLESPFRGAPAAHLDAVAAEVEGLRDELAALSQQIHAYAETAFEERRSAAAIVALLRAHGVDAELGAGGVDTAIRAETGGEQGGRTIGILGEYDALPGIGHACGHNVIAAGGVGAFLALVELGRGGLDLPGRVVFYGTPAEEGHTGKEVMARAGAFAELDAAIMLHGYGYDCADQVWLGRRLLDVTFTGVPAHASAQPFMGRNALDAASLMYQGIGLLRQQMPPVDRIHAVIAEGGTRPSIITERSRLELYLRSAHPRTLRDLSARVAEIARGAALMTGTQVRLEWDRHPASLPVRTNQPLAARWSGHQRRRGRTPLPGGVLDPSIAASTDFGNISYRIPGIHPLLKIAGPDVALHTREFAQAAASPAAVQGVLDGAYGLAGTALDYLSDDALAEAVHDEFAAAGGAVDVAGYFG
ncbi:M20 family metallopeptidase [Sediminivirga luteola]|nr:M20 family metallopeptidase [Sediminivirga luteola]MCI2265331.1 M20 family metallopeptidase [Sediminivirga luteola]